MKKFFMLLLPLVLISCSKPTAPSLMTISENTNFITLSADERWKSNFVAATGKVLNNLQDRLKKIESKQLSDSVKRDFEHSARINPTDKSYQKIETDTFPLFISTASVEPYLDGYKVKIKIGNPSTADFSGFTLASYWGPTWNTNMTVNEYEAAQKSQTNECAEVLAAGYWAPVEIVFTPATADEIRNAQITIKLSTMKLKNLPDENQ